MEESEDSSSFENPERRFAKLSGQWVNYDQLRVGMQFLKSGDCFVVPPCPSAQAGSQMQFCQYIANLTCLKQTRFPLLAILTPPVPFRNSNKILLFSDKSEIDIAGIYFWLHHWLLPFQWLQSLLGQQ